MRDHLDYGWWKIRYIIKQAFCGNKKNKYKNKYKNENEHTRTKKIGLVVTEAGEHVTAGDYFTALELSIALEKLGYETVFIERLRGHWYEIADDIDVVISLLETYDVRRIGMNRKDLIKVAWARNWFESWTEQPCIQKYDYILASSEKAVAYMEEKLSRKVHLLKIGTNTERFHGNQEEEEQLVCDYCFTGSYWNEPREIMDALTPERIGDYEFHLYGANWDTIEKFRPYNRGFVEYKALPRIYGNTKILIDDANRVTKPFGSVNSRVFDALASGVLVLTNGVMGARNTFGESFPTYTTAEELKELLVYYLKHEQEREKLVKELQDNVRKYHSYDYRAMELIEILQANKSA